jgi:hypothetical protein
MVAAQWQASQGGGVGGAGSDVFDLVGIFDGCPVL